MPSRDTFADLLAVSFYLFFGLPNFRVFQIFLIFWAPFGIHLACFLESLGTSKMEPEHRREYDSHTLDFLFPGLNSRLEFAADFCKTFGTFSYLGLHLEGLLAPFGWNDLSNIIVQKKAEKMGREDSREI